MADSDHLEEMLTESDDRVIFLVAKDDAETIRAKLQEVRGRRVALVVPPHTLGLRLGLSVRLVRQIADDLAIDLSLVTADSEVQRLSEQEGLPVFNSIRGFRRKLTDGTKRERGRQRRTSSGLDPVTKKIVVIGGLVAVVLVLLIIAFGVVPSASVTLRPSTQAIGETVEMRADPDVRSIDYVGRRIPGRSIFEQTEGTDQVLVTGVSPTGGGRAQGAVRFTNGTAKAVTVPAGTTVSTRDGVKFVVLADVPLPAELKAWKQADVLAVDTGVKGNVPRGSVAFVDGPLAQQVDVFNEEPITGGGGGGASLVSEADQRRLHDQLYDRLSKEALAKLQADTKRNETVLAQAVKLDVLEESYDRRVNDPAKALNLHMVVRVQAAGFDVADANDLAQRSWQPNIRAGFGMVAGSVQLLPPEVVRWEGNVIVLAERVNAVSAALVSEQQAMDIMHGRRAPEAASELARIFMLAELPKVVIEPFWASRAFRVHVVIEDR